MITAQLLNQTITSTSQDAFSACDKSNWGEKKRGCVEYSWVEALTLIEQNKLTLYQGKKVLSFNEALKKARRNDKRIALKQHVFADLRKKGYIVKTALKFGTEFRVYKRGVKPGQDHANWLLVPIKETETITWYEFAAKSRIATTTNKKILFGIVDEEGDVSYYEVGWLKP